MITWVTRIWFKAETHQHFILFIFNNRFIIWVVCSLNNICWFVLIKCELLFDNSFRKTNILVTSPWALSHQIMNRWIEIIIVFFSVKPMTYIYSCFFLCWSIEVFCQWQAVSRFSYSLTSRWDAWCKRVWTLYNFYCQMVFSSASKQLRCSVDCDFSKITGRAHEGE